MSSRFLKIIFALGIAAYLVFALITLPAGVLLSRLESRGIHAAGVSGTAWHGRAQVLQVGGINIGGVEWKLHALKLFTGRLGADLKVTRTDGFAQTQLTAAPSGLLDFADLTASLPLSALPANVVAGGWSGTLNIKLAQLTMDQGWPTVAAGSVEALQINGPARNPANLGSYKVTFPTESAAKTPGMLVGALSDIEGPLQILGTLQLKNDRSYLIEGLVTTRPEASRAVQNALQYLGPPDPQGKRQFSLAGTM